MQSGFSFLISRIRIGAVMQQRVDDFDVGPVADPNSAVSRMNLPPTSVDQRVVTFFVDFVDQIRILATNPKVKIPLFRRLSFLPENLLDFFDGNFDVGVFSFVGVDGVKQLLASDFVRRSAVVLNFYGYHLKKQR
jgi:hypothetical protein